MNMKRWKNSRSTYQIFNFDFYSSLFFKSLDVVFRSQLPETDDGHVLLLWSKTDFCLKVASLCFGLPLPLVWSAESEMQLDCVVDARIVMPKMYVPLSLNAPSLNALR